MQGAEVGCVAVQIEDVGYASFCEATSGPVPDLYWVPIPNRLTDRASELAGGEVKRDCQRVCVLFVAAALSLCTHIRTCTCVLCAQPRSPTSRLSRTHVSPLWPAAKHSHFPSLPPLSIPHLSTDFPAAMGLEGLSMSRDLLNFTEYTPPLFAGYGDYRQYRG